MARRQREGKAIRLAIHATIFNDFMGAMPTISVDLGSGSNPRNPYNCDRVLGVEANEIGESISAAGLALNRFPWKTQVLMP